MANHHFNIDLIDEQLNAIAKALLGDLEPVRADAVGLDRRAASELWVGPNFVAVCAGEDPTLQYYGGFEYVLPKNRRELGDYVFYAAEDRDRVRDVCDRATTTDDDEEEQQS